MQRERDPTPPRTSTDPAATLTLQELAEAADVTVRTIRYYITEGLLPPPLGAGPATVYTRGHLDRLRLIARLKDAYLPLKEIRRQLIGLDDAAVRAALASPPQAPTVSDALAAIEVASEPPASHYAGWSTAPVEDQPAGRSGDPSSPRGAGQPSRRLPREPADQAGGKPAAPEGGVSPRLRGSRPDQPVAPGALPSVPPMSSASDYLAQALDEVRGLREASPDYQSGGAAGAGRDAGRQLPAPAPGPRDVPAAGRAKQPPAGEPPDAAAPTEPARPTGAPPAAQPSPRPRAHLQWRPGDLESPQPELRRQAAPHSPPALEEDFDLPPAAPPDVAFEPEWDHPASLAPPAASPRQREAPDADAAAWRRVRLSDDAELLIREPAYRKHRDRIEWLIGWARRVFD